MSHYQSTATAAVRGDAFSDVIFEEMVRYLNQQSAPSIGSGIEILEGSFKDLRPIGMEPQQQSVPTSAFNVWEDAASPTPSTSSTRTERAAYRRAEDEALLQFELDGWLNLIRGDVRRQEEKMAGGKKKVRAGDP